MVANGCGYSIGGCSAVVVDVVVALKDVPVMGCECTCCGDQC